ncbi:MAG: HAD family hydrolase [Waddliaceae bacterium]
MKKQTLALFDFDKTITTCDTFRSFLLYSEGKLKGVINLFLLLPYFIGFLLGFKTRQETKEKVLTRFFSGESIDKMRLLGRAFAKNKIPKMIKPEALKRLEWHKKRGDRIVIVSASLNLYLEPWAQSLGIEDLICTHLEKDAMRKVTGKLEGINCWGQEKVRRLQAGIPNYQEMTIYAYGDSRGDQEMLAIADHAFYREIP